MSEKPQLLLVDDDEVNVEILVEHLSDENYPIEWVETGEKALERLVEDPDRFDLLLLDRMMPGMDGIEVLKEMKRRENLKEIPVIMQTAKAAKNEIVEGLRAGAHYYLTKPFNKATLLAIVKTALSDRERHKAIKREASKTTGSLLLLDEALYSFRTPEEADLLATLIAQTCPNAGKAAMGLSELLVNAVEHGNLGITYDEKTRLYENNRWKEEVEKRLALSPYASKRATLQFSKKKGELHFLIKDQGEGFQWDQYLEISPERAFDNHGRGIALARQLSFDSVEYRGKGNEVLAVISLEGKS